MDYLAVFRVRSDALRVVGVLRKKGIICSAVSTPSYLKLGCGLSVVFPRSYANEVRDTVREVGASSLVGFYQR